MKKNRGLSLVEMVVAIAVVLIVIVALVAVTTVSVRNAIFSRNQALATKYTQEVIEKVRAYRDQNTWDNFKSNCSGVINGISLPSPFTFYSGTGCNCGDNACDVRVIVSWTDSRGTHKSELNTILTRWK
jgi:prepilin-type N-terminal cleavage/methylation domain-containing protein